MIITPLNFLISLAVFILSFILIYAFLTKIKLLTGAPAAIFSLVGAIFLTINNALRTFVFISTPWFVLFALIIFLIIFVFSVFGASIDFAKLIKNPEIIFIIIFFSLIIIIVSFSQVYGERIQEKPPFSINNNTYYGNGFNNIPIEAKGISPNNNFNTNLVNTLLHPKMIGLFIFFLIAIFVVAFLTKPV